MDSKDDHELEIAESLESLPEVAPPEGFAERVVQAHLGSKDSADGNGRGGLFDQRGLRIAASLVAIACLFVGWHALSGGGGEVIEGSRVALARETLSIARRGVVVAEKGTSLAWSVTASGAASVEQASGNAFYRVEPGGAFVVNTPAGVVTVTGTCFRVEIEEPMTSKSTMKGAAVGAAVAVAVVVSVYEGKVIFAQGTDRDAAAREISAGERVRMAGDKPEVAAVEMKGVGLAPPPDGATMEDMLARDRVQRERIARLESRLAAAGASRPGAAQEDDGRAWFDPSVESLRQFAEECRVRYDIPAFERAHGMNVPPDVLDGLDVTDAEKASMTEVMAKLHESVRLEVRELYIAATGDAEGADSLSVSAMGQEIEHKSDRREAGLTQQRIAKERAGLLAPPRDTTNSTPIEKYYRLLAGVGDATENELAQVLGAERASKLRSELGGWGQRMEMAGCPTDGERAHDTDTP